MKVLIIGSNYFNFNDSVKEAFELLGWQAIVDGYDNPIHPFKGLIKWQHKFSYNKEKLRDKQAKKYNQYILRMFSEINPDLVFILNGNILFTQTLDIFRKTSKVIVWMYDAISRFPKSQEHIDHSDAFFCYEKQDVEYYLQQGKIAYFLPQACDENLYHSTQTSKDIDILFVGVLYRYEKRIKLLKEVVTRFSDKKILIIGIYKPWYKNPLKYIFRERKNVYSNKNIPVKEVNKYYNRSKIVINIHHETQQYGANPKVFEISGAGAYQICDTNPYIESVFPNGEIGLYHNEEELFACIEDALNNNKSAEIKKAQEMILAQHTFLHRVKEMLQIIGELP